MGFSEDMTDELCKIGKTSEDESSEVILECIAELLGKYKNLEETLLRANADIGVLLELMKKQEMHIQQSQAQIFRQDEAISKLKKRIKDLENGAYSGVCFIEVQDYMKKKTVASGSACIYSDDFYSSHQGYKMCAWLCLNGDGLGRGRYLSVFFAIKKGHYDHVLSWPFKGHVTFTLLNQDSKPHLIRTLIPCPSNPSFQKPIEEVNIPASFSMFAEHRLIENHAEGFLRNDTIAVEVKVEFPDPREV